MHPRLSSPPPSSSGWSGFASPYNYPIPPVRRSYWWTLLIAIPAMLFLLFGAAAITWCYLFITHGGFQ